MSQAVFDLIKEHDVKFIDLRFTDSKGKEQHVSIPHHQVTEDFFEDGKMFDGSSIQGWKGINKSDMVLMPDPDSAVLDPFTEAVTLNIRCDVVEPDTMQGYSRDPRSVAKRAEEYLRSTGIADTVLIGPEPEFFFLMTYVSIPISAVLSLKLMIKKHVGIQVLNMKKATWDIVLALKAVTSQYLL